MKQKSETEISDEILLDPIVKYASEMAAKTEYGAMIEHFKFGKVYFDNEGIIIKVIP